MYRGIKQICEPNDEKIYISILSTYEHSHITHEAGDERIRTLGSHVTSWSSSIKWK